MYLDNRYIMSFNSPYVLIIGANGCGKTYSCKRLVIKKALYENKKFMWIRTSKTMIDELKENKGFDFFNDIKHHFKKCDGEIVGNTIYINKKYVGRLGDVSTFFNKKGRAFDDINYIVFDEFIDETAQGRLKNKTLKLIKLLEAICRLRKDIKIILTANAIDRGDEILQLFNFNIKDFGIYRNKKLNALLWYVKDDEEYHRQHKESLGGRLMPEYVINNEFINRNYAYFECLPDKSKYIYTLEGEMGKMGLYSYNQEIYINPISDKDTKISMVKSISEISSTTTLIRKPVLDMLRRLYNNHKIRFKNQFIEKNFILYISSCIY